MKYIHLSLIFIFFIIISYFLNDNFNKNKVKENFLEKLFSKKEVDLTKGRVNPLTSEQKSDNKTMNDFLIKRDGVVDTPIELKTNDMSLVKLTPDQLEERELIINDIKNKLSKKETVKDEVKKEVPVEKPKLKADQCRFLSNQTCNKEFPVFMGASLTGNNSGLVCNDEREIVKPEAMAQIENGEVKNIVIIKAGKGFESPPKVVIKGDRYTMLAKAIATVNKEGEVDSISVISGGSGYVNTPKVIFEYEEDNKGCFLCCRLDLFN